MHLCTTPVQVVAANWGRKVISAPFTEKDKSDYTACIVKSKKCV